MNKLCDEWLYCQPISAFDLFSWHGTHSCFWLCDIFVIVCETAENVVSSPTLIPLFSPQCFYRNQLVAIYVTKWVLLRFEVIIIFLFLDKKDTLRYTIISLQGCDTHHMWYMLHKVEVFLIIEHGCHPLFFMCTGKKKHMCTEENSLFAVLLHSNNIFHILHIPCCIFGLQS